MAPLGLCPALDHRAKQTKKNPHKFDISFPSVRTVVILVKFILAGLACTIAMHVWLRSATN